MARSPAFRGIAAHGSDLPPTILNVGLTAENWRAIPRYPRAIDFGKSYRQNDGHLEVHGSALAYFRTDGCGMSADLTFATGRFPRAIWFVLVNNRVPRTDHHCGLCGGLLEKGYVRDSQTRLIYCDTQCFAGGQMSRLRSSNIVEGKRHEMFKSRLQS